MWLENDATKTLPEAFLMMWRRDGPTGGVRGVREQKIHPHRGEAGDRLVVGQHAIDGRLVELEVSCVQDRACRSPHVYAKRSGDGVCHRKEVYAERAEVDVGPVLDLAKPRSIEPVL